MIQRTLSPWGGQTFLFGPTQDKIQSADLLLFSTGLFPECYSDENLMADLSAYLNVYNTALVILERKGFSIRFDEKKEWWYAKKGDWEFLADDPMQLLGLVAIYEYQSPQTKEEYWWKIDEPDLLAQFDPRAKE